MRRYLLLLLYAACIAVGADLIGTRWQYGGEISVLVAGITLMAIGFAAVARDFWIRNTE